MTVPAGTTATFEGGTISKQGGTSPCTLRNLAVAKRPAATLFESQSQWHVLITFFEIVTLSIDAFVPCKHKHICNALLSGKEELCITLTMCCKIIK